MTAPGERGLNSLMLHHTVKVMSAVEEYCLAVGEVVGHECILSATIMNNAAVIFLKTIDKPTS